MTASPVPDPYRILGVPATASDHDLDHAFRGLIRQHHPDTRTPSDSDAEADQRLQEILTAYATLRDPIRRAAYDRTRPTPVTLSSTPRRYPDPAAHAFPTNPAEPAIRVGPVRWRPSQATQPGASGPGRRIR